MRTYMSMCSFYVVTPWVYKDLLWRHVLCETTGVSIDKIIVCGHWRVSSQMLTEWSFGDCLTWVGLGMWLDYPYDLRYVIHGMAWPLTCYLHSVNSMVPCYRWITTYTNIWNMMSNPRNLYSYILALMCLSEWCSGSVQAYNPQVLEMSITYAFVCKLLPICVLDGFMLITIPRLKNVELLILCNAVVLKWCSTWCYVTFLLL